MSIKLLVFSGESNSGGQALNSNASSDELGIRENIQILNNNTLDFEELNIGVNNLIGHANMSTPTLRHSWELGIANMAESGSFGSNPIYIVKTGHGGSKIGNWSVGATYMGINPWQLFQDRVDAALSLLDISGDNKFALLYSQGINDAISGWNASAWETATLNHLTKIRSKYGMFPIVMTKIMSSVVNYLEVNSAIDNVISSMENVWSVDTNDLARDDIYHWSYEGQKILATRLVNKLDEAGYDIFNTGSEVSVRNPISLSNYVFF